MRMDGRSASSTRRPSGEPVRAAWLGWAWLGVRLGGLVEAAVYLSRLDVTTTFDGWQEIVARRLVRWARLEQKLIVAG